MSKEVDLYFLKNPKRVAVNAAGLAEMQVHIVRTLVITFIIGFFDILLIKLYVKVLHCFGFDYGNMY